MHVVTQCSPRKQIHPCLRKLLALDPVSKNRYFFVKLDLLVEDVLAGDTVESYVDRLDNVINKLTDRLKWQAKNMTYALNECQKRLLQAKNELVSLADWLTRERLVLHAKSAFIRQQYATELAAVSDSFLINKTVIKSVLLHEQYAPAYKYSFLKYAQEVQKDHAIVQAQVDGFLHTNRYKWQIVPKPVLDLLHDLDIIYKLVVSDLRYAQQQAAYDREMFERSQIIIRVLR